jgi:hypothetical protein
LLDHGKNIFALATFIVSQGYLPHNNLDFYPFFLYFMGKEVNGNLVESVKGGSILAPLMEKTDILRFQGNIRG